MDLSLQRLAIACTHRAALAWPDMVANRSGISLRSRLRCVTWRWEGRTADQLIVTNGALEALICACPRWRGRAIWGHRIARLLRTCRRWSADMKALEIPVLAHRGGPGALEKALERTR